MAAKRTCDAPVTLLRFFYVYGEREALSNPDTGVLAIFAARYLNGRPPVIFDVRAELAARELSMRGLVA